MQLSIKLQAKDNFLNHIGLTSHKERKMSKNGVFTGQMKMLKKTKQIFQEDKRLSSSTRNDASIKAKN
jgi:hypothetical protein